MIDKNDWLAPFMPTLIVVLLALSGGSLLLPRVLTGTKPEADGTKKSIPAPAPDGAQPTDELNVPPVGFLHALALLADHVSAEPLLVPVAGKPPRLGQQWCRELRAMEAAEEEFSRSRAPGEGECRPEPVRRVIEIVRERVRKRGIEDVDFVIATLPDPVDSNSAWTFDPALAAIQQAAGAAWFVLDSFHLPDWRPGDHAGERSSAPPPGRAHGWEPGALLFRSTKEPRLLLVLTVGEAATAGLHKTAFFEASRLALLWHPSRELKVLGPTFSGSIASLHYALRDVRDAFDLDGVRPHVRVVTGSATNPLNEKRLTHRGKATSLEGVEFSSTVRSDSETMAVLARYLGRIDPGWACGHRMALLHEATTVWGAGLKREPPPRGPARISGCEPDGKFPRALRIGFPLHVSRLRTDVTPAARVPSEASPSAEAAVALQLGEGPPPADRLPSFTPGLTAATAQTTMAGILDTIRRHDITALGILATDKRDHLFLAQEITRRVPNLQVFTIESNLLYLHPDAGAFLRGTLVASTYPLYDRTQLLTRPEVAPFQRRAFESGPAQGVYNAFVRLVEPDGTPEEREKLARDLVDYRLPITHQTPPAGPGPEKEEAPPVWISVVGRGGLIPLAVENPPEFTEKYVWPAAAAASPVPEGYLGGGPGQMMLALLVALLVAVNVAFAVTVGVAALPARQGSLGAEAAAQGRGFLWRSWWAAARRLADALRPLWSRVDDGRGRDEMRDAQALEHLTAVYACAVAVAVLAVWELQLGLVWWVGQGWSVPQRTGIAVATVRALAFAGAGMGAVAVGIVSVRHRAVLRIAVLLVGIPALGYFLLGYLGGPQWEGVAALLQFDRATSLGSLVSPTPVIVLFCAALYGWGAWNLRRVHLVSPAETKAGFFEFLQDRAEREGVNLTDALCRPGMAVQWWSWLPLATAGGLLLAGRHYVDTIDGQAFGRFLWFASVALVVVFAHTLAHSLHFGRGLLRIISSLDRHPIAPAFARVGKEPFNWKLSFRVLRAAELEPLTHCAARLGALAADFKPMTLAPREIERACVGLTARRPAVEVLPLPGGAPPLAREGDLARAQAHELGVRTSDICAMTEELRALPRARPGGTKVVPHYQDTHEWKLLGALSVGFWRWLTRSYWDEQPAADDRSPAAQCRRQAETILAFQIAIVLRDQVSRLVSGLTLTLTGFLAVTAAHLLYAFQGRRFWLAVDWWCLVATGAAGVWLLIRLEKSGVLSRLWSTDPGRVNFSGGLIGRIALYAAVPVLTVLTSVFPDVVGGGLQWLEPVRKAMP